MFCNLSANLYPSLNMLRITKQMGTLALPT